MQSKYIPPELGKQSFYCPHCNVFAHQVWNDVWYRFRPNTGFREFKELRVCECFHCNQRSVWLNDKMLSPETSNAPLPHPEMPEPIKADYDEARKVFRDSPRSSAALLRLAIQKLCKELGQKGDNINADISALVGAGLPVPIQQSLDIVRVVGNNAVHPGQLDVNDDPTIAAALFELVNLIVEDRIARPKQIDALYLKLPETARKAIEERNAKAVAKNP